ncbi:DUF3500 domain-containing protein [Bradyrhizobium sp. dw_411]|uniref:DUF3500 domain-containing protein n=1 Tax=Bradyrhizobium sp. dw_411 TaxID=2720082 RepID=UPI001BD058FF|nr:DUF3500 domain-containing protein [Bradyrhizobium sp. dw_411]
MAARHALIRRSSLALIALMVFSALIHGIVPCFAEPAPATGAARTQAIVDATNAFLNTLDAGQREKVQFPFVRPPTATAARFKGGRGGNATYVGEQYGQALWSDLPASDVPRPGLRLGNLSAPQRDGVMHLLQVLLSVKGYRKVLDIMGSDQALAADSKVAGGAETCTLGIFGAPGLTAPWMIQFGGHHLALNITIAGARGVLAPAATGAQPAVYTSDGKTIRVLAEESDKAFALLGALDDSQRKQMMVDFSPADLQLGPGHDGETIKPEGLKASAMTGRQRQLLLDLISEWVGIVNDVYAAPRMAEIEAGLDDTYFAWNGPMTSEPGQNATAYFRIQGPKVVIEFAPQELGWDLSMHVHTIYRDTANAYGRGFSGP